MNIEKIGAFIKELRNEAKMTQKELAEKLGITDRAVSKWERGKGCPDISYLEDISNIFNVSIKELLKGERSNEDVSNKEYLTSLKYGMFITKENIYSAISNILKVLITIILLTIIIFNLCNFYYANKEYKYEGIKAIDYLGINVYLDKIELIKNDKGKFTNEEHQTIVEEIKYIEKYLKELANAKLMEPYKYEDFNFGNEYDEMIYLSSNKIQSLYKIILKYNVEKYDNMLYVSANIGGGQSQFIFFKNRIINNIITYNINRKNIMNEYIDGHDCYYRSYKQVIDDILEVGEIDA